MSFALEFEWDPRKATTNRNKHGIGFELAATVFQDRRALTIHDSAHSAREERWITLGLSADGRLLVVVHTWREDDPGSASVRIISARSATKREQQQYETS
jgi:uncharacterized protein